MKNNRFDLKIAAFIGWFTKFWRERRVSRELESVDTKPISLITGGSGGIGAALAHEFAEAGHHLLLIGQDEARLRAVAERVNKLGSGEVLSLAIDLSDLDMHQTIDDLLHMKGFHVEVLLNNAGLGEREEFLNSEWSELEHVIDVNIKALTALTHRYLPLMVQRGSGALLNIASLGGLTPGPYNSIYFASKAYVIHMTEALANEVRGKGVYIAAVLPGPVKTAFHSKIKGQNSLYNILLLKLKPRFVARSIHRGMLTGLWAIITPGLFYSFMALFLRIVPGSLMAPFMGFLYKSRKFK